MKKKKEQTVQVALARETNRGQEEGFIYGYVPWVGVRCGESYTQEHLRGRGDDKNGFNLPTANLQSTNDACGAATSSPTGWRWCGIPAERRIEEARVSAPRMGLSGQKPGSGESV